MPLNYLDIIVPSSVDDIINNILVSGEDAYIKNAICTRICTSCYGKRPIIIVNSTRQDFINYSSGFGRYRKISADGFKLLSEKQLLDISDFSYAEEMFNRFFDNDETTQSILDYLELVANVEKRFGNHHLNCKVLQEYGSPVLFEIKCQKAGIKGDTINYYKGRYAECSKASINLERFLRRVEKFLGSNCENLCPTESLQIDIGKFSDSTKKLYLDMVSFYIESSSAIPLVIVIDDGIGDKNLICKFLDEIPAEIPMCFFSQDAFSLKDEQLASVFAKFPTRIYCKHSNPTSAEKVSKAGGDVQYTKLSYGTTIDNRIKGTSALDFLLGNNKTKTTNKSLENKPRFKMEEIVVFAQGLAIVDLEGEKTLYQF